MTELPTIVCTSVVRSSFHGDSHGGVYIVDMNNGSFEQVVDWDDCDIDWSGRGGDRGLRGISVDVCRNRVYIAASNAIAVYDTSFNLLGLYENKYLSSCHETFLSGNSLHVVSTNYDSVLCFDVETCRFTEGYCFRSLHEAPHHAQLKLYDKPVEIAGFGFDPESDEGPIFSDTLHLNNVFIGSVLGTIYVSGVCSPALYKITDKVETTQAIPHWTHNTRFYGGTSVIANITDKHILGCIDNKGNITCSVSLDIYKEGDFDTMEGETGAEPNFCRGLAVQDRIAYVGGSPATIHALDLDTWTLVKSVKLTRDVRNSIHGLEVWPYVV